MFRLALVTVFSALAAFAQVADTVLPISELMRSNPGAALRQMVSEQPQTFQGSLRSLTFNNPESGLLETRTTLQVGETAYPVYSDGLNLQACMDSAKVRGYRVGGEILAASIENAGPLNSPACSSTGVQKTLVLLVDSSGTPKLPPGLNKAFVQGFMSTGPAPTVDGYFQEISKGLTSVNATVEGPFTIPNASYSCATNQDPQTGQPTFLLAAMAATNGTVDFTQYSRIILIGPVATANPACSTRAYSNACVSLTAPGNIPLVASWGYIASDILPTTNATAGVNLASKVIGNGMGMGWSYTRDIGTQTLGPIGPGTVPPTGELLNGNHSIMGWTDSYSGIYPLGHIPAEQKASLGWYSSGAGDFLNVQTSGSNVVLPVTSSAVGPKALRVRRGTGYNEWLWVEYRQLTGNYESTLTNYAPTIGDGVMIHHERPSDPIKETYLLHFKPVASPNNFARAMLVPGTPWTDPYSNLTLSVAAAQPGPGMVVTATYGAAGGCLYPSTPSVFTVSNAAGNGSFNLGTGTYCEWSASSSLPFVAVTAPTAGMGPATVAFSYTANGTGSGRSATIDVGIPTVFTQAATVNQSAGAVAGVLQISGKTTLSGGNLAGVTMTLSGSATQTATTNATGDYALTGLGTGTYTVTPTLAGHSFTPANATFTAMASNQVANFAATKSPYTISLDRTRLNYAARNATVLTPLQKVLLSFTGGGTSAWTASSNQSWVQVTPAAGTGSTRLTIALVPGLLPAPGASTATVTITAPGATNPTLTLPINLSVLAGSSAPFGNFDTPTDGATNIAGAIPVTGWAMDDIFVTKLEIFRDPIGGERPVGGLTYIGDALFVADARPDIEGVHRTLPFQYRGGWGYMMLTNMIPAVSGTGPTGNGTIRIWAVATDVEGNKTTLGSKTITLNNAAAKKPFGALDTPGPGATASGTAYATNGWVLTPQPNIISSVPITLFVDSSPVGNMTYGIPRGDIALYFPGYRNTNGAGVTYNLDTTKFANGVHTIAYNAYDDANPSNGEGIGSRYFFVENGVSGSVMDPVPPVEFSLLESTTARSARPRPSRGAVPQVLTIQEMAWLTIPLPEGQWRGAQVVNDEMRPLPVGSALDNANGEFRWILGPGFLGTHELLFTSSDGAVHSVTLNIEPKTYGEDK